MDKLKYILLPLALVSVLFTIALNVVRCDMLEGSKERRNRSSAVGQPAPEYGVDLAKPSLVIRLGDRNGGAGMYCVQRTDLTNCHAPGA